MAAKKLQFLASFEKKRFLRQAFIVKKKSYRQFFFYFLRNVIITYE